MIDGKNKSGGNESSGKKTSIRQPATRGDVNVGGHIAYWKGARLRGPVTISLSLRQLLEKITCNCSSAAKETHQQPSPARPSGGWKGLTPRGKTTRVSGRLLNGVHLGKRTPKPLRKSPRFRKNSTYGKKGLPSRMQGQVLSASETLREGTDSLRAAEEMQ